MDHPKEERFDLGACVLKGLRELLPKASINLDRVATYDGGVHTLVQGVRMQPVGLDRLLFSGRFSVVTLGPDFDQAAAEAERVADACLSLTVAGGVVLSSVLCEVEPERLAPHPSGAEALISSYRLVARRV